MPKHLMFSQSNFKKKTLFLYRSNPRFILSSGFKYDLFIRQFRHPKWEFSCFSISHGFRVADILPINFEFSVR